MSRAFKDVLISVNGEALSYGEVATIVVALERYKRDLQKTSESANVMQRSQRAYMRNVKKINDKLEFALFDE